MHDTGTWVICALLAWLIVAAFAQKKARWRPFGGMFTRDRRTGAITMALTLPTRKSTRKGRKR